MTYYVVTKYPVSCPQESSIEGVYPVKNWESEAALMEHLEREYGPEGGYEADTYGFEIHYGN